MFLGTYDYKLDGMKSVLPHEMRHVSSLFPFLIPNYKIFDEKERYLLLAPWKVLITYDDVGAILHARECSIDKYYRVVLPKPEALSVGIRKNSEVSIMGCRDYIEIWSKSLWEETLKGYDKEKKDEDEGEKFQRI